MNTFYFQILRTLKRRGLLKEIEITASSFRIMVFDDIIVHRLRDKAYVKNKFVIYKKSQLGWWNPNFKEIKIKGLKPDGSVDNWHELMLWMDKIKFKVNHKKERVLYSFLAHKRKMNVF